MTWRNSDWQEMEVIIETWHDSNKVQGSYLSKHIYLNTMETSEYSVSMYSNSNCLTRTLAAWCTYIVLIASAIGSEDRGFESRQGVRFLGLCILKCLVCIVIVCI
jgi:hypothetical protein